MKFIKLECPNCGGKLKVDDTLEKATCIHCGYDFIVDKELPEIHHHYYESEKTPEKTGEINEISLELIAIIIFILVGLMAAVALPSQSPYGIINTTEEVRTLPVSQPMVDFMEYVFRKPVATISSEELETIKYLELSYLQSDEIWTISYSFFDYATTANFQNTVKKITIETVEEIDKSDLQAFTGLTAMHLSNEYHLMGSYTDVSFWHLTDLTAYTGSFNESLSSAMDRVFWDVEKIQKLSIQLRNQQDLENLLNFSNLQCLTISYLGDEVENLGQLSALKKLHTLTLENSDDISWLSSLSRLSHLTLNHYDTSDYQVLFGLPNIESLTIYSGNGVKSLDFVKSMPKLKSLYLQRTEILTLQPLTDITSLQSLKLHGNSNLTDLSAISTLTSLRELEVEGYKNNIPDLTPLNKLQSLSIYHAQLPMGKGAENVKHLSIENINDLDGEELIDFKNLESLALSDGSLYNVFSLNKLSNLSTLKLEKIVFSSNEDELHIFQLENIKSLSISNSTLYFDDVSKLSGAENPVLKKLYFTSKLSNRGADRKEVPFDSFPQIYEFLPNLEVLHLPEQMITSLDFTAFMPKLVELNLMNNYITDVSPLLELDDLAQLWIGKNSVTNLELLNPAVAVLK